MSTRTARTASIALLVAAGLLGAGCGKSKEEVPPPVAEAPPPAPVPQGVTVVGLTLGNAVGMDKKVTAAGQTFTPSDTIYASVDTSGTAASATLAAKWTYQDGQTVHEESQSIAPTGSATTEFHIAKPDGWPKGSYKVEIMLDGVPVRSASFNVS